MPRPTALSSSMSFTVKINGRDLYDYGVLTYEAPFMGRGGVNLFDVSVPERHVPYLFSGSHGIRSFVITGTMMADSVADLHTNLDALKEDTFSLRGKGLSEPAPLRIEFANLTDRHWNVFYVGPFEVRDAVGRPTSERIVTFSLPLAAVNPFAIANTTTHVTVSSPTGPDFTVLNTGSAPHPFLMEIEGAANAFDFVLSNMAFYADLDYDLVAKVIDGTENTGTTAATTKPDQFRPGDWGGGQFAQDETFDTTWTSVIQNPDEQTWILYVTPQFANTTGNDEFIFSFYTASNDYVEIFFDTSENKWAFRKNNNGGGNDDLAEDTARTFSSGDTFVLAISCGADGMKIYVDGELVGDDGTTTDGINAASGTVELGEHADTNDGACLYDFIFGFPFQLSDDEVRRYSKNPRLVKLSAVKKSKTGNLSANERAILDFEKGTVEKLATDLTKTNDASDWDGNAYPWLYPQQTCLYVPTSESSGNIKIAYRKWYL